MMFELTVEAKSLQSVARRVAEDLIAPRAAEVDRTEAYP
jgi:3-sulfinopropanoyl-CoA desulfinase